MTLQLHVKISTRYTELKFQLGLAKPRSNFNPGWKFQIFHICNRHFLQLGMKIWYYARANSFLFNNFMLNFSTRLTFRSVWQKLLSSMSIKVLNQRCHCHFVFWPESNLLSLVIVGSVVMIGANHFGN